MYRSFRRSGRRLIEAAPTTPGPATTFATPDTVTIDNEYSGQTTTLPRTEFIRVIEAYQRELDAIEPNADK